MKLWSLGMVAAVALTSTVATAAPVYIDFNESGGRPANFNKIGANEGENTLENLVDANGEATEIDVTVTQGGKRASGRNGVKEPTGDAEQFGAAMADYLYGKAAGLERAYFDIVIGGLEPGATYNFVGSAARSAPEGTSYITHYKFIGANTVETTLEPANNTSETFTADGVAPNDQGQIKLRVGSAGPENEDNMYLISALKIEKAE